MISKRAQANLALGFCALIWGATFVVIKDALADVSVVVYLAVRFGLAAALMAAIYWRSLSQFDLAHGVGGRADRRLHVWGYAFQIAGLKFTTPSKAAFITGSCVVIVPILLGVFGRRRITAWVWAGALAALAGLYFLTVPSAGLGALNRGDPLVLVCALDVRAADYFHWALRRASFRGCAEFLASRHDRRSLPLLLPVASAVGWEQPRLVWTGYLVFAILLTAIGATVIGFSLQTWAQQYAPPSHAAILLSLEPVFAAITSFVVGQEHLGARALVGAALILAGILFAEWRAPAVAESPVPSVSPAE